MIFFKTATPEAFTYSMLFDARIKVSSLAFSLCDL